MCLCSSLFLYLYVCNCFYMWRGLWFLCVLCLMYTYCLCVFVCVCFLSTLCGAWDISCAWFWGHLAAMEGTACGVLPLCIRRTRALSYCARHQWVWHGCEHTQTHVDWLAYLSYFLVSFLSDVSVHNRLNVIFGLLMCDSLCLLSLTDLSVFYSIFPSPLACWCNLRWLFFVGLPRSCVQVLVISVHPIEELLGFCVSEWV